MSGTRVESDEGSHAKTRSKSIYVHCILSLAKAFGLSGVCDVWV